MEYIITGGAGYIGEHLAEALLGKGEITILSQNSNKKKINPKINMIEIDLRDEKKLSQLELGKNPIIFHLAANPDVKTSMSDIVNHYSRDVTLTLNVLEMARKLDAEGLVFTSSSVVYGETKILPTPEETILKPISNYGLFKTLGEEMVTYYANNYGINSTIFRMANVIGGKTSHGVMYDFVKKLEKTPEKLEILGDGRQKKSYVYVFDVIEAFLKVGCNPQKMLNILNLGSEDSISVDEIAKIVKQEMKLNPKIVYSNKFDGRGWAGDVKQMLLDTKKINSLGWKAKHNSTQTTKMAVRDLLNSK